MNEVFHIETPLIESKKLSSHLLSSNKKVLLKLDNLQPSGSFKIRGIGYLASKAFEEGKRCLISSSGGNAGMAVAYAGYKLNMKVTVVVPKTTPESARNNIKNYGADVIVHGSVWDEADKYARNLCEKDPEINQYCHPFDNERIWKGHSSMVDEIKEQMSSDNAGKGKRKKNEKPCCIVLSVGGGGLLCGVAEGLHNNGWKDVPIVTVETNGAASFFAAKAEKKLVRLPGITSLAKSLGACQVSPKTLEWDSKHTIYALKVSDKQCVDAVESFATDHRMLVEPACAVSLSSIYEQIIPQEVLTQDGPVVVIVCGGNIVDVNAVISWKQLVASSKEDNSINDNNIVNQKIKPSCVERFYTNYIHKLVDLIGYNFPPGPNIVPAYYIINAFKAGTLPFCILLMNYFNNFSASAYLITALHGSYGFFWLLKHCIFPDPFFSTKATIMSCILIAIVLTLYWSSAILVIAGPTVLFPDTGKFNFQFLARKNVGFESNIPSETLRITPERMFVAIFTYVIGLVLMMASDTQKYFVLKLAKEHKLGKILINDGWFGNCRNTNYAGEAILYSSFAICSQSWIPWCINAVLWGLMFGDRFYQKEQSFRRKKGGLEYIRNTSMILPFGPLYTVMEEEEANRRFDEYQMKKKKEKKN